MTSSREMPIPESMLRRACACWTRLGAYAASAWLALIAVNLVTTGQFLDIAARDAALAIAAFSLARLDEARGVVRSREPSRFVTAPAHV